MELVIGGAYQGKLEYAKENLGVVTNFECNEDNATIDFSSGCVSKLELYVLACLRAGKEPWDAFEANPESWQNCILIANDISQGVVPISAEMRAWREATGRLLNKLSGRAAHVHRVFLGIGQVIK